MLDKWFPLTVGDVSRRRVHRRLVDCASVVDARRKHKRACTAVFVAAAAAHVDVRM